MTAPVFVDTNVLVYARDSGEPAKQKIAARWLADLWKEQTGRTSVQVLSEYYVTVTRKLRPGMKPDQAWDDVQALMAWDPQSVNLELMTAAREVERRYRISWWDSMIVAAAQLQGCKLMLSEDMQDGAVFDRVTVRNPFSLKVEDAKVEYRAIAPTRSRHPRRGRPPRTESIVR
jgi:predicted nucleic acid-binding protein